MCLIQAGHESVSSSEVTQAWAASQETSFVPAHFQGWVPCMSLVGPTITDAQLDTLCFFAADPAFASEAGSAQLAEAMSAFPPFLVLAACKITSWLAN